MVSFTVDKLLGTRRARVGSFININPPKELFACIKRKKDKKNEIANQG